MVVKFFTTKKTAGQVLTQFKEILLTKQWLKTGLEWTMNGWLKPFRKSHIQKNSKTYKADCQKIAAIDLRQ